VTTKGHWAGGWIGHKVSAGIASLQGFLKMLWKIYNKLQRKGLLADGIFTGWKALSILSSRA
jgi:hypothetical protein